MLLATDRCLTQPAHHPYNVVHLRIVQVERHVPWQVEQLMARGLLVGGWKCCTADQPMVAAADTVYGC